MEWFRLYSHAEDSEPKWKFSLLFPYPEPEPRDILPLSFPFGFLCRPFSSYIPAFGAAKGVCSLTGGKPILTGPPWWQDPFPWPPGREALLPLLRLLSQQAGQYTFHPRAGQEAPRYVWGNNKVFYHLNNKNRTLSPDYRFIETSGTRMLNIRILVLFCMVQKMIFDSCAFCFEWVSLLNM